MNIVVSLNANYLRPLCVMLRSLLDANPGEKADVYVLHASLSPEAFSFARSALPDGRLRLFDVRVPEDFMADAPVLFHFPKEMYYRIFSARLLPQTLGRALYLDPDMVINRPLAPLYGMELGEHFFAAARSVNPVSQVEYKLRLDMPEESEYFNSGVLLMNLDALRAGLANLGAHVENMRKFGIPVVVAINRFYTDTEAEISLLAEYCASLGVEYALSEVFAKGGEGGVALAQKVLKACEQSSAFHCLYETDRPIREKIETIAREIYGADGVALTAQAEKQLREIEALGQSNLPVCMAKTQYSLSDNPALLGRPSGFIITVKQLSLSAGAGFIVALTGDIMTMPGLPKTPAANQIDVDADGNISGLF